MFVMRGPRVLLVIALLLGQMAAVAHLSHDAAADAASDTATACEHCLHAAGALAGLLPADSSSAFHVPALQPSAPLAAYGVTVDAVGRYLIRGPPPHLC